MDCLTFIVELTNGIAWPVFWFFAVIVMLVRFEEEIRALLRNISSLETPLFKLYFAAKEAAPKKDIPLPPRSAKHQVLNEWQKVHDRLAQLYEEKVGKTPPGRYRPLASRLKNQGHVTGTTAALVDEVRNVQRRVKKQPDSSVSPQLADYYATIVTILLDLLGNPNASTDSSTNSTA